MRELGFAFNGEVTVANNGLLLNHSCSCVVAGCRCATRRYGAWTETCFVLQMLLVWKKHDVGGLSQVQTCNGDWCEFLHVRGNSGWWNIFQWHDCRRQWSHIYIFCSQWLDVGGHSIFFLIFMHIMPQLTSKLRQ